MTTGPVRITAIFSEPTRGVGVTRHDIVACRPEALRQDGYRPMFETLNPWLASLCEHAMKEESLVVLTWEPTKYGATITAVAAISEAVSA